MDLIQQVLGQGGPLPVDGAMAPVLPIPGAWAAANQDDALFRAYLEAQAAVAVVPPGQDDAALQAGSAPPLRRTSERVQRIQAQTQALAAAAAAFAAATRAEAEAQRARIAAEQAAAGVVNYVPLGGLIAKLQNKDNAYLQASNSLLPALLGGYTVSTMAPSRVTFKQLFSLQVVDLCRLVYGDLLTQKLLARFSQDRAIRDFFELTPPQTQCARVLGGLQGPIQTHCWICGTRLQQPPCEGPRCTQDCEHRADIGLAMTTTGIYDSVLHNILGRAGRGAEYMNLLRHEYAWSHALCNRIKKDAHFLLPDVNAQGRVTFQANNAGILAVLNRIFDQVPRGYPPPQAADIMNEVIRTPMVWSGIPTDRTLTPIPNQDGAYVAMRPGQIAAALNPLAEQLNALGLTPRGICLRFTNGLLLRAIHLAPELTKESIWESLPPEYQGILSDRLRGGRRRTRRRGQSRKRQRGGGNINEKWRLMELILESILSTVSLAMLFESLVNMGGGAGRASIGGAMEEIANQVDAHVQRMLGGFQRIDLNLLDYGIRTRTGIDLIGFALGVVFAPPPPALTVNTAAPAAVVSGPSTPISAAAVSRPSTPVQPGTPSTPAQPFALLSPQNAWDPRVSSLVSDGTVRTQSRYASNESEMTQSQPYPASPQQGPPKVNRGVFQGGSGFKFTMGKRPDWL